jgi:hypothetical protein
VLLLLSLLFVTADLTPASILLTQADRSPFQNRSVTCNPDGVGPRTSAEGAVSRQP